MYRTAPKSLCNVNCHQCCHLDIYWPTYSSWFSKLRQWLSWRWAAAAAAAALQQQVCCFLERLLGLRTAPVTQPPTITSSFFQILINNFNEYKGLKSVAFIWPKLGNYNFVVLNKKSSLSCLHPPLIQPNPGLQLKWVHQQQHQQSVHYLVKDYLKISPSEHSRLTAVCTLVLPSHLPSRSWYQRGKLRSPAMPEDRAVVWIGQLEVLGRGSWGEADHLKITPVFGKPIKGEVRLCLPCLGRWCWRAMELRTLVSREWELRCWCRWGQRTRRTWWRACPACCCCWLPAMTGPRAGEDWSGIPGTSWNPRDLAPKS